MPAEPVTHPSNTMIEKLRIENFKTFAEAEVELGRVNLFIGANGSGKSNFLEAIRVLQGLAMGLDVDSVLNGNSASAGEREWPGVRGGKAHVLHSNGTAKEQVFCLSGIYSDVHMELGRFDVKVKVNEAKAEMHWPGTLKENSLKAIGDYIKKVTEATSDADKATIIAEQRFLQLVYKSNGARVPLSSEDVAWFKSQQGEYAQWAFIARGILITEIANMQFFDPQPEVLRRYVEDRQTIRMGERGEYFPLIIQALQKDENQRERYLNWLHELTPDRIEDIALLSGEDESEVRFAVVESGRKVSAKVLSDGTLRFAALLAVFFQNPPPGVLLLEDVETGLHPDRLRLLMEMFIRLSAESGTQIIMTTHSPLLVDWAVAFDGVKVFVCKRGEDSATQITSVDDEEHWRRIKEGGQLGGFFAEGGLEAA